MERGVSAMNNIKNHLRTTLHQNSLNGIGVLRYVVCLCKGCDGCCVFCLYLGHVEL